LDYSGNVYIGAIRSLIKYSHNFIKYNCIFVVHYEQFIELKSYSKFYKYYDKIMGDRSGTGDLLHDIINKHHPLGKTVLELACGTGAILEQLSKKYTIHGLDISSGMLSIARKKLPTAKFYRHDMTFFRLNRQFDVIVCVFDSINHLLKFSLWKKVFYQSYKHLNDEGLLIFDMNTAVKFKKVLDLCPVAAKIGSNFLIIKVIPAGKRKALWNIKIFEQKNRNNYKLYEESIKETTFPAAKVKEALAQFRRIVVIDPKRKRPSSKSERLFFICKK
jgi:SAM-dependent methyltransferase